MIKNVKLLIVLAIFICGNWAIGQDRYKLNLKLHLELEEIGATGKNLPVFIKGDLAEIQREVEAVGGIYKYGVEEIASVEIPANQVRGLAQAEGIERIEYYNSRGVVLNDYLTFNNNLDSVHLGEGNLPMPLKGNGVILAVIDTGIEWRHPDLQNADSTTRILYIWDQIDTTCTNNPMGYDYGCEWNSAQINADTISHDPTRSFGHGSRVAGLAAGNGNAVGAYVGAAPETDICLLYTSPSPRDS